MYSWYKSHLSVIVCKCLFIVGDVFVCYDCGGGSAATHTPTYDATQMNTPIDFNGIYDRYEAMRIKLINRLNVSLSINAGHNQRHVEES